jgi:ubiquitin-activating enzyme E1
LVVFEGIEGMTELNHKEPMVIKSTGLFNFTIGDTREFSTYLKGGYVRQVKEIVKKDFPSLKEALENPNLLLTDFGKFTRPNELHAAFQGLHVFISKNGRLPKPYNEDDAKEMINYSKKFGAEDMNTEPIKLFSYTCSGNLNPLVTFLGGFAAQEVQKSITGKFSPLDNFMYFESFECLPTELPEERDCQPVNSRYDGQIVVFGSKFQKKVMNSKIFVVGAGALGCEFLKNFAMTGLGCGEEGKITITDMDNIEKSNLSRQFLFRNKHVGKEKSKTAAKVITKMNEQIKINSLLEKVAPETENVFNDEFWESLDFVVNAVDNVNARLYVDSRCVYFRKPLLESGTLGTKANTQVVYPFLTETYGSSR